MANKKQDEKETLCRRYRRCYESDNRVRRSPCHCFKRPHNAAFASVQKSALRISKVAREVAGECQLHISVFHSSSYSYSYSSPSSTSSSSSSSSSFFSSSTSFLALLVSHFLPSSLPKPFVCFPSPRLNLQSHPPRLSNNKKRSKPKKTNKKPRSQRRK